MPRTEYDNKVEYRNNAGQIHSDGDLPAVEWNNGDKGWWIDGKLHRIDNPAFIYSDGNKSWYLNGWKYSISRYYSRLYLYKGIITNA